jgi:hypothetical protein
MLSGPPRPGLPQPSGPCRATHAPSSAGRRDPWRWSHPRCRGRDSGAGGRSAAEGARWSSWRMIIGRSLAPLNSSRTLRAVRRARRSASVTTPHAGRCRVSVQTARRGPSAVPRLCRARPSRAPTTSRCDHPARHGLEGAAFSRMMGPWWGDLMMSLREHIEEKTGVT